MDWILAMKWSWVAFGVSLLLSLLSMGALGAALYYACYPLFAPFYGNLNDWRGDWVWNAIIWAGLLWSLGFLVAGGINLRLQPGTSALLRGALYGLVLWASAALVWAVILQAAYQAPTTEPQESPPQEQSTR